VTVVVVVSTIIAMAMITIGYVVRVNFLRQHTNAERSRRVRLATIALVVTAGGAGLVSAWVENDHPGSLSHVISNVLLLVALIAFAIWRFGVARDRQ